MLLSEMISHLNELLLAHGDLEVVVRSLDEEYESASYTDYVELDGNTCLLID
jgi:hypothetical protein